MSAKGLDSLDRLFRDYMLDEPDTFAEALARSNLTADLDAAHRRVVQTRDQIAALTPLEEMPQPVTAQSAKHVSSPRELEALTPLAAR